MPSDALRSIANFSEVTNTKRPPRGGFIICEPTVPQVEPIFDSVIKTYYKLQELGFTEVNGKIVFIDNMEVNNE